MTLKMTTEALNQFIERDFPQALAFTVREVSAEVVVVEAAVAERDLRPGNTVSGPTIFAAADIAIYLAILSQLGPKALTVTTNASIDFMRKPQAGQGLVVHASVLKLGRHLAVGEALVYSNGMEKPVARASMTYSIPPKS